MVEFFNAANIFDTLWLLYGNETVPWFDAVIRMERKTNRHRKRACLVQCFCGQICQEREIYIIIFE